ncbi:hypothetical protein ACFWV1_12910 [Streptomyces sp. NPDC058700]|uniref:hypothetical protein n=1 Tax=Streptomyces sp. NPDC058700 TaxID=3346607 RepID=UPI0036462772
MRKLATAALAASILLALTACSASENPPATPATKPGAEASTSSPSATADAEAAAQACTNAVYAAVKDADADTDDFPKPAECASISDSDYLETVFAVLQQSNKEGRDALKEAAEDAASAATPSP